MPHTRKLLTFKPITTATLLYGLMFGGSLHPLFAQSGSSGAAESIAAPPTTWHSDQATLLTGLSGIGPKTKGSLSLSPTEVIFATPGAHSAIDRTTMMSVTVGDERVEMGGTAGRITRAVIPFGGGAAVATVTNKQIDLLTIEFRDKHNALHGAVFSLPKNEAIQAQQQLGPSSQATQMEQQSPPCQPDDLAHKKTMKVSSITTLGEPVPAEYRVLLYEQLMTRLREKDTFIGIYRDGDNSAAAACTEYNLALTLSAFKKGNAALRASTGPVGYFIGTTSLTFHVRVQDLQGTMLLDKDFKVSQRGDSESLEVADKIAKSLSKKLRKASERSARS